MRSESIASPTPPKGVEPEEWGDEVNERQSRCGIQGSGAFAAKKGGWLLLSDADAVGKYARLVGPGRAITT